MKLEAPILVIVPGRVIKKYLVKEYMKTFFDLHPLL